MSDTHDELTERVVDALDASTETLPPGVATRLAAARSEAIRARARGPRFAPGPLLALASTAAVVLAVLLFPTPDAPIDPGAPDVADAGSGRAGGDAELAQEEARMGELEMAMELDLLEELEFVAWLALEDPVLEQADAT